VFTFIATAYLCLKFAFLYSLIRIQVKFEQMSDRPVFLGVLFTAGVAFLSYVFLASWQSLRWEPWQLRIAQSLGVTPRLAWLGETLVLSVVYFKLLARFDERGAFWLLLFAGLLLVWF
jgi:hypothetical protein